MARESHQPQGARDVGLLALHDRDFFERLLENPREAIGMEDSLDLSEDAIQEVEELIKRTRQTINYEDALAAWERYHRDGDWEGGEWKGWDWRADWIDEES